jgi:hypothetical protein
MNTNFNMNITKAINENVNGFINRVSTKYGINKEDLHNLWVGGGDVADIVLCGEPTNEDDISTIEGEDVETKPVKSKDVVNKRLPKSKSPSGPVHQCPYLFTRGPNKGTKCKCDIKQLDKEYCTKHTQKDKIVTKQRKTQLIPETTDNKAITKVLRKNKTIDRLWHEETGMVFNSNTDRTVVSRLVDGELMKLTEQDIDMCKDIGFAYRESTVEPVVKKDVVEEVEPVVKKDVVEEVEPVVKKDVVEEVEPVVKKDVVEDVEPIVKKDVVEEVEPVVKKDDTISEIEDLLSTLKVNNDLVGDESDEEELLEEEE